MSSTETQEHIGTIHSVELPRDAVHIAVVQITAGETLVAGDYISKDGLKRPPTIGIVDPFLDRQVKIGEKFYLFLFPGSVTDLTHHYTHPILDADDAKVKARNVIMEWVETMVWGDDKEDEAQRASLYETALKQYRAREPFNFGGLWRNESLDEEVDEEVYMKSIYEALEILTGQKATKEQRETYYSCCV